MSKAGISLLEMLVVIAVTAMIGVLAAPRLTALFEAQGAASVSRALQLSLGQARYEAIRRGTVVVACKSGAGDGCDPDAGWEDGWLVFEDPVGYRDCQLEPGGDVCAPGGGAVLQVQNRLGYSFRVSHNHNVQKRVVFQPDGQSRGYTGRFTVCSEDSTGITGFAISQTGRMRSLGSSEYLPCP